MYPNSDECVMLPGVLDDTCSVNSDCFNAIDNSICNAGECECDSLYFRVDPDCFVVTIGDQVIPQER